MDVVHPDWSVPSNVRAFVTTRAFGDMAGTDAKARLRERVPSEPAWLKQVHGTKVVEAGRFAERPEADASTSSEPGRVCG